MTIIGITSGLGNQLFQYAFGRAFSLANNTEVKFDIKHFEIQNYRSLGLTCFNIVENWASENDVNQRKRQSYNPRYFIKSFFLHRKWGLIQKNEYYFVHKPRTIDKAQLIYKDVLVGSYIQGYFLSQDYFQEYRQTLLGELTMKSSPTDYFRDIHELIHTTNSVSIHIRRGDYLNNNVVLVQPMEYYKRAINFLQTKYSDLKFFIFTDDKPWVKSEMTFITDPVFVDTFDYEELVLMSKCKHNIIANSTFSWWAAWLNNNNDKTVLAPSVWYKDPNAQKWYLKSNYIPSEWIKM